MARPSHGRFRILSSQEHFPKTTSSASNYHRSVLADTQFADVCEATWMREIVLFKKAKHARSVSYDHSGIAGSKLEYPGIMLSKVAGSTQT